MSCCPVSFLTLEEDLEGWGQDNVFNELFFYVDQDKYLKDIDILLGKRLKNEKNSQRILLEEEFALSESEVPGFSSDGDEKFGNNIEPLTNLAELCKTQRGGNTSTSRPK